MPQSRDYKLTSYVHCLLIYNKSKAEGMHSTVFPMDLSPN
jgi:hypothetical protein